VQITLAIASCTPIIASGISYVFCNSTIALAKIYKEELRFYVILRKWRRVLVGDDGGVTNGNNIKG